MEWGFGILILIVVVAAIVKTKASPKESTDQKILYQPVDSLLTPAEQRFLKALDSVLDSRFRVFSMVRVADVIKPAEGLEPSDKRKLFLKTSQKHFDFVICDSATVKPVCVIELNDKSHQKKSRIERDDFLATACASANLPLKFVRVAKSYDKVELNDFVNGSQEPLLKKVS